MLLRRACVGLVVVCTTAALVTTPAGAENAHVVRPGETLSGIADRYDVAMADLVSANGLDDPHHLVAGRRLVIPGRRDDPPAAAPADPPGAGRRHTIRYGDTLSEVAAHYGVSLAALVAVNGIEDPNDVPVGTELAMPTPTSRASSPTSRRGDARLAEVRSERHLAERFRAGAAEADVDAATLMALAFTESRWRQDLVSSDGAVGVGQLLPDTAAWLAERMGEPDLDPARVEDNVRLSAQLLRVLLDACDGDERTALAAYFQGIGAVRRTGVSPAGARYAAMILERRTWFDSM